MAITNVQNFGNSLDGDQNDAFFDEFAEYPSEYEAVAKMREAPPGNHYKAFEVSPLGSLREKPEGTGIQFDFPVEGHTKEVTYTSYALGYQITKEMFKDDLHGKIRAMPRDLAASARQKPNVVFFNLFNNGFASETAWDGQYVFDTDHTTLKSGETIANEPTTNLALSETAMQAAYEYYDGLVGESGRPISLDPYLLLVPVKEQWMAKQLVGAENVIDSANNNLNTMNPENGFIPGLKVMVSRYLTSDTAWFLISRQHGFFLYWKERAEFDSGDDFYTSSALFKVEMRFAAFVLDYKGAYGSTGA